MTGVAGKLARARLLAEAARSALTPQGGVPADVQAAEQYLGDALVLIGGASVAGSLDMAAAVELATQLGWEVDPDGDGRGLAELEQIVRAAAGGVA